MYTFTIVSAAASVLCFILAAILSHAKKRRREFQQEHSKSPCTCTCACSGGQRVNKLGVTAPDGCFWDDDDNLVTSEGEIITDIIMLRELLGDKYDEWEDARSLEFPEVVTGR